MCTYHFHCSDGERIVVDVIGLPIRDYAEMRAAAADRAYEVLALYPDSDTHLWFVTVQDGEGRQIEVSRFDELLSPGCGALLVLLPFTDAPQRIPTS